MNKLANKEDKGMKQVELNRRVDVIDCYDVVVVGAGPAGICAAVAAARSGLHVALVERYGVVGGNLTIGHVGPILGMVGLGTMREELLGLLHVAGNDELGVVGLAHDFERAKRVLTAFLAQANVDTYLQSPVIDVIKNQDAIQALVIGGKDGLFAISGTLYIDASGDGDVAALAGCEVAMGRETDRLTQPVTLEFLIDGVDESRALTCIGEVDGVQYQGEPFIEYTKRHCRLGHLPEHLFSVRLHRTTIAGQRNVNTTQANRIDALDPRQVMKAEVELRDQIGQVLRFLNEHVEGYEQAKVISSAATLGVRETRRIIGEYVLTQEDVMSGRRFADAIVHQACFIVDIHNPVGGGQSTGGAPVAARPYDIPYRCFVPKRVDNLYTAGRCISGTHGAMASYRVMSICMAMGQAVGVAAAACVREHVQPRMLPAAVVQRDLRKLGIELG
jgi:hypothetical protein